MDPTIATNENVDIVESKNTNGAENQDFKEYDINEYDAKEIDPSIYEDSFYDYNTNGANPTGSTYESEFGPGRPAETQVTESNVSWLLHLYVGNKSVVWQENAEGAFFYCNHITVILMLLINRNNVNLPYYVSVFLLTPPHMKVAQL